MTARQATFLHKLANENHAELSPNEKTNRSGASSEIGELKNIGNSVQYSVRLGLSCRMVHPSGGVPSTWVVIN